MFKRKKKFDIKSSQYMHELVLFFVSLHPADDINFTCMAVNDPGAFVFF